MTAAAHHLSHEFAAAALVTIVLVVIYFLLVVLKAPPPRNQRTEIVRMAEALMQDFCDHPSQEGYDNCIEFMVIHSVLMREIDPRLIEKYIRVASEGDAPTEIISSP